MKICSGEGCGRKHYAKGLCRGHYLRRRSTGDAKSDIPIGSLRRHDVRHGTTSEYSNYGCRCDDCKRAHSEYMRNSREIPCIDCGSPCWRAKGRPGRCEPCSVRARTQPIGQLHGTTTGYGRGCRCSDCRRAANEARRANRHKNIERERAYWRSRAKKSRLEVV